MSTSESDDGYRPGVGVVLLNDQGRILVARRLDMPADAWQMPQGGIEPGETPRQAALRELREEIGISKAEIIAESKSWLRYDVPVELMGKRWDRQWRGQRQKWFIMRFTGMDEDINVATEHPEFSAWKWISARELSSIVVSFKRQVYLDLLVEFPELGRTLDERLAEFLDDPIIRLVMAADRVDEQEFYALLNRVSNQLRRKHKEQ